MKSGVGRKENLSLRPVASDWLINIVFENVLVTLLRRKHCLGNIDSQSDLQWAKRLAAHPVARTVSLKDGPLKRKG